MDLFNSRENVQTSPNLIQEHESYVEYQHLNQNKDQIWVIRKKK